VTEAPPPQGATPRVTREIASPKNVPSEEEEVCR
jgi:hypothetical protein